MHIIYFYVVVIIPNTGRYSMSAVTTGELVILLGGVGLASSPDIIVVNLSLQLWFGMMVSTTCCKIYCLAIYCPCCRFIIGSWLKIIIFKL